jgi:hypothetical protein
MMLVLHIHYSRASDITVPDHVTTTPSLPLSAHRDGFGNWYARTGYLGDIGTPPPYGPMDFAAWFEAYLGGRWETGKPVLTTNGAVRRNLGWPVPLSHFARGARSPRRKNHSLERMTFLRMG